MMEQLSMGREFSPEKFQADIMQHVAEESGEEFTITAEDSGEYAYESDGIENLVIEFEQGKITIIDITARNPGSGIGSRVIGALTELAEEMNFDVVAKDVLPSAENWWEHMHFAPVHEGSADRIYVGEA